MLLLIIDKCDFTCGSVYPQPLTSFDPLGSLMHTNHSRDAKFPGYHRAVGHHPADLHNEPTSGQKKRRPGWVGSGADQYFARGQLGAVRVKDHPGNPFHFAGRNRIAYDGAFLPIRGTHPLVIRHSVAEKYAWNLFS